MNRKARRAAAKQAKAAIPKSGVGRTGEFGGRWVAVRARGRASSGRPAIACRRPLPDRCSLAIPITPRACIFSARSPTRTAGTRPPSICIGRAIALDARSPQFHYNIGLAFAALGRIDEAIRHNRSAIELRSDYADAHNNLAAALRAKGQLREAVAHYRRALALKPGVLETYDDLAGVLLAEGDADAALEVVRRALSIKETQNNRHLFVQCMKHLRSAPQGRDLRDLLVRALLEPWGGSAELARIRRGRWSSGTTSSARASSAPIRRLAPTSFSPGTVRDHPGWSRDFQRPAASMLAGVHRCP